MTEKNPYPSDQADKVLVRMPDGMRDRLKDAAKANNRTMNAEIVARLEASFLNKGASDSSDAQAQILQTLKQPWPKEVIEQLESVVQKAAEAAATVVLQVHGTKPLAKHGSPSVVVSKSSDNPKNN